MGHLLSTPKREVSNCTSLMASRKLSAPQLFTILMKGNQVNYYELFGFPKRSCPDVKTVVKRARELSMEFHPDKHPDDTLEEKAARCAIFCSICDAKETFMDPEKKARYDQHLRDYENDYTLWEWMQRHSAWCQKVATSVLLIGGGVAGTILTGGLLGVPAVLCGIATGGALSAGITGAIGLVRDPDKPLDQFVREIGVSALVGALTGGVASGVGAAVRAELLADVAAGFCSQAALRVSVWAARGALLGLSNLVGQLAIQDAVGSVHFRFADPLRARPKRSDFYLELTSPEVFKNMPRAITEPVVLECFQRSGDGKELTTAPIQDMVQKLRAYSDFGDFHCLKTYTFETQLYHTMNNLLVTDHPDLFYFAAYVHNLRQEVKLLGNQGLFYRGEVGGERKSLWRGGGVDEDSLKAFTTKGARFLIPQFTSTSLSEKVARKFLKLAREPKVFLEIDCSGNMGDRGYTYVVPIKHVSAIQGEEEYLFFPFSGFEVIDAKYLKGVWEIKLRVLDTMKVEANPYVPK